MPTPIPALPDLERRTAYSVITSTTGPFNVGFDVYGDSTDFQNWIEVYVDGESIPYNDSVYAWSVDSPSGPLATLPRPITDARVTFALSIPGSGGDPYDIQIVGARRPRRTSQFGNVVPPRDLNKIVTDHAAMLREGWDARKRTIMGQPGETIAAMPSAADRANALLGFDSFGQPRMVTPSDNPDAAAAAAAEAAAISAAEAIAAVRVRAALNRAAMQAFDTSITKGAVLYGETDVWRNGYYGWSPIDNSANVTADTAQSIFVPPTSDLTGASGAWRKADAREASVSITGALTVSDSHDGCTLRLGGGSFFALTFPAGSALRPNFRCTIVNTETTAIAKGIAGVNVGNFLLYGAESYTVYNDAGTLRLLGGSVRRYRKANISLYVDDTNGNDSPLIADGLSTGARAYKTIGAAIAALYRDFDHNGSFPIITIAAGTYNESITISGTLTGAGSNLFFLNGASPVTFGGAGGTYSAGVRWRPAGAGTPYCLIIGDLGILSWSNIFFDSSIVGTAIQMHQASVCDQNGGGGFGSFGNPGGVHIGFDGAGATYNISASYAVSGAGGGAVHIQVPAVAQLNHAGGITVTMSTAAAQPNIGMWFRGVGSGSNINLGAGIIWVNSPLVGCQKWLAGTLASLALSGNGANVPGSVAGSPAAGAAPAANLGMVTA